MKINGLSVAPPKPRYIVLPHGETELVLLIQGVYNFDEFEKMCPEPQPPATLEPGGKRGFDFTDKRYHAALSEHREKRLTWLYLKALEPSDLEYEKVILDNPDTYKFFDEEFDIAGIAPGFVRYLKETIIDISGFNQEMIKEATDRFLAGLEQEVEQSSPSTEPQNT